jgi:hypothetical protein
VNFIFSNYRTQFNYHVRNNILEVHVLKILMQIVPWAVKTKMFDVYLRVILCNWGYVVAQLVEALRYKPGGRGFDFRRCH